MGKVCMKLRNEKVGSIGIGAMIVFIAMVLVAGIAASVLIQTSTKLETQAMASGQETIAEVSSGLAVDDIYGYNKSGYGQIVTMAIGVRPRAGSADMDLTQTVIELSDSASKNYFVYDSDNFTDTQNINGDLITDYGASCYPLDGVTFGVIVVEDADSSISSTTPVLNKGDHVFLTINCTAAFSGLDERDDVFGMVIPEDGSPGIISFTTPASFSVAIIELQ